MLEIKGISKQYVTGELTQVALDNVSFNLRESEFVAILGPSGSGKTTLLNIIGGLDRYDSGDLVINNISTKQYKDRDWDSYRNHTIGFVFQSYNLIPHQSILSNVELALTISGISRTERKRRARTALEEVGLGDQIHKRPNQMSGGQMQRVAIARALVNDPDILLADEPTGALDSETSVQVMDLIKQIAKDRLVIMVTHNAELADEYANRIIQLRDGHIISDSNPYIIEREAPEAPKHKNMGKASMSFGTALALSFNNLRTKKGRTVLTSFAGSIGIIGIALILALSTGVNGYITDIQKDTMVSYPIQLEATAMDLSSMIQSGQALSFAEARDNLDKIYSNSAGLEMANNARVSIQENNLSAFKSYLDDESSEIHQYVGTNGIVYAYDVGIHVYTYDPDGTRVNTDGSDFERQRGGNVGAMSPMSGSVPGLFGSQGNFEELLPAVDGSISEAITDNYEVIHGTWPAAYDEVVLVLNENNEIATSTLYELGFLPAADYDEILEQMDAGEDLEFESYEWDYEDVMSHRFSLIPSSDFYPEAADGSFRYVGDDEQEIEKLLDNGIGLKIVGIVRPSEDASYAAISGSVAYTKALTDHLIEYNLNSAVVKAQAATPDVNVLSGMSFDASDDETKIDDIRIYVDELGISDQAKLYREMMSMAYADNPEMLQGMAQMDEAAMADGLREYMETVEDDTLLAMYDAYVSAGSYDDNMQSFGYVSLDAPTSISIYADDFESKDAISLAISHYNDSASQADQITYTDYVGLLMSSVTTIVNVITYVLIAFVAVSLVVSSIMIGIITFISVLERTKEIGILRAIGASKSNISQVFNAETFIVGLLAGLIGIGVTELLLIPGNAIIHHLTGIDTVNAVLTPLSGLVLILLSMILTLVAGLLPAKKAAKKDPVEALRTD